MKYEAKFVRETFSIMECTKHWCDISLILHSLEGRDLSAKFIRCLNIHTPMSFKFIMY